MKETNIWDNKNLLKILPFYNILIDFPRIKRLSNAKLLYELPFYDSLNIKEKYQKHLKDMQKVLVLK